MPTYCAARIEIIRADITALRVDMIVNAANARCAAAAASTVRFMIAAGPELLAECRALAGAKIGDVKVTAGYRLPAQFVAHAVGPVWEGPEAGRRYIASPACYRRALELLVEHGLNTIAFPSISTGAQSISDLKRASRIALSTVRDVLVQAALDQARNLRLLRERRPARLQEGSARDPR